eukprot:CAMPEP_0179198110 /NCGR_PEP_ID=MMETSP0796-20121207/98530_1 /TAXON_ID=73915 /ORGANISM="Pyrodinium bahamense, Strain pbaha01" /LENGTH=79 /DNA_ID=CAMNT_0020902549 /DNA_START=29 /DNA_END=265 /DNA_ORIENTATION=+
MAPTAFSLGARTKTPAPSGCRTASPQPRPPRAAARPAWAAPRQPLKAGRPSEAPACASATALSRRPRTARGTLRPASTA